MSRFIVATVVLLMLPNYLFGLYFTAVLYHYRNFYFWMYSLILMGSEGWVEWAALAVGFHIWGLFLETKQGQKFMIWLKRKPHQMPPYNVYLTKSLAFQPKKYEMENRS